MEVKVLLTVTLWLSPLVTLVAGSQILALFMRSSEKRRDRSTRQYKL